MMDWYLDLLLIHTFCQNQDFQDYRMIKNLKAIFERQSKAPRVSPLRWIYFRLTPIVRV